MKALRSTRAYRPAPLLLLHRLAGSAACVFGGARLIFDSATGEPFVNDRPRAGNVKLPLFRLVEHGGGPEL